MSELIDESLYSRQLYVLGHNAMNSMKNTNVLIYGLNGVGVEIAKNVILSGIKTVDLYDTKTVTYDDLATNFYCTENDIDKNRASVCKDSLADLNAYVSVNCINDVTNKTIQNYDIFVTTDIPITSQIYFNNLCRTYNVKYIHAETHGVFGKIFCDFGNEHIVNDTDGEEPVYVMVENITHNKPNEYIIKCVEPHTMQNDATITITEVHGLNFLNNNNYKIKVIDRFSFKINDDNCGIYYKGGKITEVKQTITISFKTLEESIKTPEFLVTDWLNVDRNNVLHACFNVLGKYELDMGKLPKSHNTADINDFVDMVKDLDNTIPENEINTIKHFSNNASGQLIATNSVIGGIAAQEIIKACTHKFTPIKQFLYFDSIDSLSNIELHENEYNMQNSRYDSQIKIFGKKYQQLLQDSSVFIVGAGAIGCELMKNFVMSGIGCGSEKGRIYVTDMDTIEKSNLNRQFLFRQKDVGNMKSIVVANAALKMNSTANIIAHENKVGSETDIIYGKQFFDNISFVANALDNVEARKYVDSLCVIHKKPLFESGTLGTKGNTQTIIPHLTESYGSTHDPPETSIPICTLKNFPATIEHTIQWARDKFEGLFTNAPQNANKNKTNKDFINNMPSGELALVYDDLMLILVNGYVTNFDECIKFAYKTLIVEYRDQILQLLHQFPPDHKTDQNIPFWTGTKRCPDALIFDVNNDNHMKYVITYAQLWANMYNIPIYNDIDKIKNIILNTKIDAFIPNSNVKISVTDKEEKEKEKEQNMNDKNMSNLPNPNTFRDLKLTPLIFEKDDDTNGHIDFITIASNLRATNYKIENADKHKTKGIAGKIIPAIATTTSIVAGLVMLEMYKYLHGHTEIEKYRSTTLNLALPFMAYMEPIKTTSYTFGENSYSLWDAIVVSGDRTVGALKCYLENKTGVDVDSIVYKEKLLDSFTIAPMQRKKKQAMLISDAIKELTKTTILPPMVKLIVNFDTDEDITSTNIKEPDVHFYFEE